MAGPGWRSVLSVILRGLRDIWFLLRDVARRGSAAHVSEAAATMAYYAFFSLFPLLVVLVVAGSYVLEAERAFEAVVGMVGQALPGSRRLIEENVHQVIRLRGPVGLVGILTLVWSASSFFSLLTGNIERAWPDGSARSAIRRRLLALAMVVGLAALMALSLLASALLQHLPAADFVGRLAVLGRPLGASFSRLLPWALSFMMFLSLYRWMPNRRVPWRAAMSGAGVVTILWLAAGQAFVWYLGSGLARYELVYGSIGAVIVLLLWIYLTSLVTLTGAHLTAALGDRGARASRDGPAPDRSSPPAD